MDRAIALELVDTATAALTAQGLDAVLVTTDQEKALNAAAAGDDTVFIGPPAVEYDTYRHATATWTAYIVAAPRNRAESWTRADELVAALRVPLGIDDTRPYDWQPDDGEPLIAYEATFTTDHDL